MKDADARMRFRELRAQGLDFTRISKGFGVAKHTLINRYRSPLEESKSLKSEGLEGVSQETLVSD